MDPAAGFKCCDSLETARIAVRPNCVRLRELRGKQHVFSRDKHFNRCSRLASNRYRLAIAIATCALSRLRMGYCSAWGRYSASTLLPGVVGMCSRG